MQRRMMLVAIAVAVVLLIGAVVAGAVGFQIGFAQGAQTSALQIAGDRVVPAPGAAGPIAYYARPLGWGHPFGGVLACLFGFVGLFVLFGMLRLIAFRGMRHWAWGGPGAHGPRDPGAVPAWAEEWHRKMHEKTEEDRK